MEIGKHLEDDWLVLDPFAGVGRIHLIDKCETYGVEIEPEWAEMHPGTIVADALDLPFPDESFDALCTSPCYGNRMADHHDAKDGTRRMTYRHLLGRPLHENNSGQLQWGQKYRDFHVLAWREAFRVLKPGGRFILNISDHIRKGERQRVSAWHVSTLLTGGLELHCAHHIETPRMRNGENSNLRVGYESVVVFDKS